MSEVKKWYIGVYGGEAQARPCSPAEFEIINEREGRYFVLNEDFDRVTAERDAALGREAALKDDVQTLGCIVDSMGVERDALQTSLEAVTFNLDKTDRAVLALQQLLTAADERVDVLETALRNLKAAWASSPMSITAPEYQGARDALDGIALKPAEAGHDFRMIGTEKMPPMEYDEP